MKAIALGVHVLDVLVRPVESIPEGQGGQLVDEIRITAAGSAGGAALVLAKLGADVRSAGAIGTDPAGDMLLALLGRDGVDTGLLVRRDDVQTSASVLPIRPTGERPAFHVVGANGDVRARRRAVRRDRGRGLSAHRRSRVHGRRGRGEDPEPRARERHDHVCRRARARRSRPARVAGRRPPRARLPAAQRRAGPRLHGRGRFGAGLPRARRARRRLRGRHLRRRRRRDRRRRRNGASARLRNRRRRHDGLRRCVLRRLPPRPGARARVAAMPPCSDVPPPRSSRRGSEPTMATSTLHRHRS